MSTPSVSLSLLLADIAHLPHFPSPSPTQRLTCRRSYLARSSSLPFSAFPYQIKFRRLLSRFRVYIINRKGPFLLWTWGSVDVEGVDVPTLGGGAGALRLLPATYHLCPPHNRTSFYNNSVPPASFSFLLSMHQKKNLQPARVCVK